MEVIDEEDFVDRNESLAETMMNPRQRNQSEDYESIRDTSELRRSSKRVSRADAQLLRSKHHSTFMDSRSDIRDASSSSDESACFEKIKVEHYGQDQESVTNAQQTRSQTNSDEVKVQEIELKDLASIQGENNLEKLFNR